MIELIDELVSNLPSIPFTWDLCCIWVFPKASKVEWVLLSTVLVSAKWSGEVYVLCYGNIPESLLTEMRLLIEFNLYTATLFSLAKTLGFLYTRLVFLTSSIFLISNFSTGLNLLC